MFVFPPLFLIVSINFLFFFWMSVSFYRHFLLSAMAAPFFVKNKIFPACRIKFLKFEGAENSKKQDAFILV